jgi:hypothetical protein
MTERRNGCLLLLTAALLSDSATALEVIENRLALNLFGTLGQSRSSLDTPLYKDMSGNNYGLGRQWSS